MIPRKYWSIEIERLWILIFCLCLAAVGPARASTETVGEVSLAIGVSRLIDNSGHSSAIARGMPVHAGDRIETEQGGHVHLRFVDGAFVSVRPGSRLTIDTYRYDSAHPKDSAIRFKLEQGVARSISGKGAEAAHDRFRLNTPIAAIGVRGTDFVVLAEADRVRAAINSGAIVMTPLGEGCSADTLGPCATSASRELSADMGKVMLEFQRQQAAPRVVPINGALPDRLNPPAPEEPRGDTRGSKSTTEKNTEVLSAEAVAAAREQSTQPPPCCNPPPPPPPPPPPATIVWGRWASQPLPGDSMSVSFAEAKAGRVATLGNDYYGLFRPEPRLFFLPTLGRVDFTLRDAQVYLLRGNVASLGSVDGGWLSVDFGARQFSTGVTMSHSDVGTSSLQASGKITEDALFSVRNADGRVGGALSADGKEAGYYFERPVNGGTFMGITRWFR